MQSGSLLDLQPNHTLGAQVTRSPSGIWRLEIPAGPPGHYRLAQLDDYTARPRRSFLWRPPLELSLRARVSAPALPGTWGFGLWNDPFSLSLGLGGAARRFPALPNAAWYFYASPPNYLSFRDDLPAQGLLAATFQSLALPAPLLALGSPIMTLGLIPLAARLLRPILRALIHQDAVQVLPPPSVVSTAEGDREEVTNWHTYAIEWHTGRAVFSVDGQFAFETAVFPHGPLALVLWIDNQYAALPPRGRLAYGMLPNPEPAWLELAELTVA